MNRFNTSVWIISFAIIFLFRPILCGAQTDPGNENLKHQWTFDDGTANDIIGSANGTLQGGATISNKALNTSAGGYLYFPGNEIGINTYSELTTEVWFKSSSGQNSGNTMLIYFGNADVDGWKGTNYIFTAPSNGGNCRLAISTGNTTEPWIAENGVNNPSGAIDDGQLHQLVSIIDATTVSFYLDGTKVGSTSLTGSNQLSAVSSAKAFLCKSGYSGDPLWKGYTQKYSIYNKALSDDEVLFLYQQGAESSEMITASVKSLAFDNRYKEETIAITGINLDTIISVSTPAGITANPTTLPANATNSAVKITYDGTSVVDGNITFSSGDGVLDVPVKSYSNDCFTPLYEGIDNLVPDPYVTYLSSFSGWGNRSINSDPDYTFCGATSGKVTGTNGGSLDVTLTGKVRTNAVYRIRAQVFTIGGAFQIGMFGWSNGQGDFVKTFNTSGTWQEIDFTITTGATLGTSQGIFFNNYGLSGTTGYIDNWEMYALPAIHLSQSVLEFNSPGTKTITVSGMSLIEDILVSSPEGFTVSKSSIPADANGVSLTVNYVGESSASGYICFESGDVKDSLQVIGSSNPAIEASVDYLGFDEISSSGVFKVTAYNLSSEIGLTAPEGITLSVASLPSGATGETVTATYDGSTAASGFIYLTSGSAADSIQVQASRNDECFQPLFPDRENLIVDPTCNTYLNDGWGSKSINSDPEYVYCGSRSGKVSGSGSLDRKLTGKLKTNTSYRMRAKVFKVSTTGDNMGNVTFTMAFDSTAFPEQYRMIKTAMDSACHYFNKYTPFIENIRVVYNAGIPTAQASYHGEIGFGANSRYMWVGTAIHEMAHYFGSGTTSVWQSTMVNGKWTGNSGNSIVKAITGGSTQVVSGDNNPAPVHYWPYGINQKEEITGLGSQAVQKKALADAVKLIKAMLVDDCDLPTNNPKIGLGVYGWNASKGDLYYEVDEKESWQDVDVKFRTGSKLKSSQGVFFNSGTGYIDNWELYELSSDAALSDLRVNGTTVLGFDPAILEYNVELDSAAIPEIVAVAASEYATTAINSPAALPGSATIKVTAEDSVTINTYTVNFSLTTSIEAFNSASIKVYPTYSSGEFTVETSGRSGIISVYNLPGKLVSQKTIESNHETLMIQERGMYLIKVECEDTSKTFKVFKTR
ncbi:LamG-like jellyroll fold domain-containing protein [Maribellus sediminis]|uniref:LamG-like jellyroll fold domain-containing protein n=1 Tax=Maribellus sediminis TaxID=2696285 RepID=UPI001430079E|nr:LamG-like jellyroll fold domain-containing protein [Maribellus sediminis]